MVNLHLTPGDEYRTTAGWYDKGFVDNQIWVQAMGMLRFLNEQRGAPKMENQRVLWRTLMLGMTDPKEANRKWHTAQTSMRYAAVAVDQVNQEITVVQTQVGLSGSWHWT